MNELHDMHCHLDFMANGEEVAASAQAAGTLLFANTVTPEGWLAARERFAGFPNVTVGFGMHPWWVVEETADDESAPRQETSQRAEHRRIAEGSAGAFDRQALAEKKALVLQMLNEHSPRIIGEIGLDFGWRHAASREAQLEMFEAIAHWVGHRCRRIVSLHSIKAARETLDILEQAGALTSSLCIFHWFSGPSDQLKRAIEAECYFSCGPRMLATAKGREYVKAIPANLLLLETDAPPERNAPYSYAELRAELESAATSIAAIKGNDALETIAQTSRRLLNASSWNCCEVPPRE